ncbi:TlpA family protein disulfide reductase [Imhoffiella purpurea]|uniref:Thioredoxin family protein n=1 Tax=Imhoffiella purpurea TaxID=1249627 RepID=W9VAT7_9GAMM|nr:TlpA disulfide reductase family protein [Imhoffiella purpurea]EXJ16559.1 thioredoxin family protein [Imhoffiella purpurea]
MPSSIHAILMLICCLVPLTGQAQDLLSPVPDRPRASDFALADIDGQVHRLSDYHGRPLLLNFWATWCPPCRAEMPSLQRAHEQLEPEGIGVMAINVGEDPGAIAAFLEFSRISLPLPMDRDTRVAQRYPVVGLPTTFVIGPNGRIQLSAAGELQWDDPAILDQIRALKAR